MLQCFVFHFFSISVNAFDGKIKTMKSHQLNLSSFMIQTTCCPLLSDLSKAQNGYDAICDMDYCHMYVRLWI